MTHGLPLALLQSAAADHLEQPEIQMGEGVALIGREPEQPGGFRRILRQAAAALIVEGAERVLGAGKALIGGELVIMRRLVVVPRQAEAPVS